MKDVVSKAVAFLKSNTGHKVFGVLLGAASTYLLQGHVDVVATLRALGVPL